MAGSSGALKPEAGVSLGFSVSGTTELPEVFGASFAAPKEKLRDGWGCAVAEVVVVIAFDAVNYKKNIRFFTKILRKFAIFFENYIKLGANFTCGY